MESYLVDTSVWIDYLKGAGDMALMDRLIYGNHIVTNDIILTELLPSLIAKGEKELADRMRELKLCPLEIRWEEIRTLQTTALRKGINRIGVPDLIIAQNALQNDLTILTLDRHFKLLQEKRVCPVKIRLPHS